MTEVTDTREYTKYESARIARSLSAMPYGGALGPSHHPTNVEELCRWLDALAERLASHAVEDERKEQELQVLRSQRAAIRSFLGTGGYPSTTPPDVVGSTRG